MTPQETERTAELLLSLAGQHSVVVVEHDMEFVRLIASQVTVLHEGSVLAEGDMDTVQNDPARHRGLPGRMSLLTVKALNQFYGGSHTLWDVDLAVAPGSRTCLMGRNGMGKTTLLKMHHGTAAGDLRRDDVRRHRPALAAGGSRARLGIGYVPQGREIFPQLTVEENLRIGLGVRKERRPDDSRRASSSCSRCSSRCCTGAAATCPAVSSSSWRSAAPWCSSRRCSSSTSRPKASSRTSCTRSATSS